MSTGHQAASSGTETHNFGGAGSEEPLADCEGLLSSIKSACSILESSHLPELEKLFSDLEGQVGHPGCTVAALTTAFRQGCDVLISESFKPDKSAAALYSRALDAGNNVLRDSLQAPGGISASSSLPSHGTAGTSFWQQPPDVNHLLQLRVHSTGCVPPDHGRSGKRISTLTQFYNPDSGPKRARTGSGKGSKFKSTAGAVHYALELPEALQSSIAFVLEVMAAAQFTNGQDTHMVEAFAENRTVKPSKTSRQVAEKLLGTQAVRNSHILGIDWSAIVGSLHANEYSAVEEIMADAQAACRAAAEIASEASGERIGKLKANGEQLVLTLHDSLQILISQHMRRGLHETVAVTPVEIPLPASIQANREPYLQGDWRQLPYAPRPYKKLKAYEINEEHEVVAWKMTTQKRHTCNGQHCTTPGQLGFYSLEAEAFKTQCECLALNMECGPACGCASGSSCLNRGVTNRQPLRLGKDVKEVDSWGMDCYTRRNIIDAVLESQAFGPYQPPDYAATLTQQQQQQQAAAGDPLSSGETLQHNLKGADALIAAVGTEALPEAVVEEGHMLQQAQAQQQQQQQQRQPQGVKLANGDAPAVDGLKRQREDKAGRDVTQLANRWLENQLIPAINDQGKAGWDIAKALASAQAIAKSAGDEAGQKAAAAVQKVFKKVGYNYFRIHPKGTGIVCTRPGGLPALTFIEEYLGEVHAPWRWFEIQDAIKKKTGDDLPDFYNIVLERPRDDPAGYDVLFIDAASKGAFASRMSHSCTPNCQAVVMSCGGKLTIAVYTLRGIAPGEELTFDYASVTENEREFKCAICLCGTQDCRGSFLYFSGSRAFMQVMTQHHNMFHRQAILLRAAEPLTEADLARLDRFGLRASALGRPHKRLPGWLIKWAALVLEFVELERQLLPAQLLALQLRARYTPLAAAAEAKGVSDNRLQNIAITLDKVRLCMQHPGQPQKPPLRLLSDEEAKQHVWSGYRSLARRLVRCMVLAIAGAPAEKLLSAASSAAEASAALASNGSTPHPQLIALVGAAFQPALDFREARSKALQLVEQVRAIDVAQGGGFTALADIFFLCAFTRHWFYAERDYKGFQSAPVRLNLHDLNLDRMASGAAASQNSHARKSTAAKDEPSSNGHLEEQPGTGQADSQKENGAPATSSRSSGSKPPRRPTSEPPDEDEQDIVAVPGSGPNVLAKKYGPHYMWGQLTGWHKQTVADPTASLSAERRGTLSLPDLDSCGAGAKTRYTAKDRDGILTHIEKRPDSSWKAGKDSMWSFRNEAKVYGSPMHDAVWEDMTTGGQKGTSALQEAVRSLRAAPVPWKQ